MMTGDDGLPPTPSPGQKSDDVILGGPQRPFATWKCWSYHSTIFQPFTVDVRQLPVCSVRYGFSGCDNLLKMLVFKCKL